MPKVWCKKCSKQVDSTTWHYSVDCDECTIVAKCHGTFERRSWQIPEGWKGISTLVVFEGTDEDDALFNIPLDKLEVTPTTIKEVKQEKPELEIVPFCFVANRLNQLFDVPTNTSPSVRPPIEQWLPVMKDAI